MGFDVTKLEMHPYGHELRNRYLNDVKFHATVRMIQRRLMYELHTDDLYVALMIAADLDTLKSGNVIVPHPSLDEFYD